ncbi:zinc finger protein 271-like [Uranotaenia lowii]|uniref:zinc finger protein 271-like n=1 Tax=Uranotaenia lowii TaxID=190385 RepID=UPI00247B0099|nr:zinc finger protein 271-like [Uranotaenia lowii]
MEGCRNVKPQNANQSTCNVCLRECFQFINTDSISAIWNIKIETLVQQLINAPHKSLDFNMCYICAQNLDAIYGLKQQILDTESDLTFELLHPWEKLECESNDSENLVVDMSSMLIPIFPDRKSWRCSVCSLSMEREMLSDKCPGCILPFKNINEISKSTNSESGNCEIEIEVNNLFPLLEIIESPEKELFETDSVVYSPTNSDVMEYALATDEDLIEHDGAVFMTEENNFTCSSQETGKVTENIMFEGTMSCEKSSEENNEHLFMGSSHPSHENENECSVGRTIDKVAALQCCFAGCKPQYQVNEELIRRQDREHQQYYTNDTLLTEYESAEACSGKVQSTVGSKKHSLEMEGEPEDSLIDDLRYTLWRGLVYRCCIKACLKEYKGKSQLLQHLKRNHADTFNRDVENETICSYCDKPFDKKADKPEHHRHFIRILKCLSKNCIFRTKSFEKMEKHWKLDLHDGGRIYPSITSIDESLFTVTGALNNKIDVLRLDGVQCCGCFQFFSTLQNLQTHVAEKHRRDIIEEYQCTVCSKIFLSSFVLVKHSKTTKQRVFYFCQDCSQFLWTLKAAETHSSAVHASDDSEVFDEDEYENNGDILQKLSSG